MTFDSVKIGDKVWIIWSKGDNSYRLKEVSVNAFDQLYIYWGRKKVTHRQPLNTCFPSPDAILLHLKETAIYLDKELP